MNQWIVLDYLKQLTELDEEGETQALSLCHSSIEEILVRLRPEAPHDDPRVLAAVAALAFYKLTLKRIESGDDFTFFSAGDVTVRKSPNAVFEYAVKIKDDALSALAPLLIDDGFMFMKVGDTW